MSKPHPDFGRFHAAVTREQLPDRVPNAEVHVAMGLMEAFLGVPVRDIKTYASFWEKAGYDFAILEVRGQFIADSFQVRISEGVTAMPGPAASVSTFDTARIADWKSFEEYPWVSPDEVYYKDVDLMEDHLPDGMKVVACHGPIFSGMMRIMGLETLSVAAAENPELIRAVADKMGKLAVNIVENLVQRESVGAIWFGDDIAYSGGLMVSPGFLRTYIFPFYRQIGDLCRRYQKPFIYHSDGKLADIFEDLIECGAQAIHPNEPLSVDIAELKQEWGARVALIGNIDVDLLARGTPGQVTGAVKRLIEKVAPGGGFALGSGNSIADFIPLPNYKAMLDTVLKCGHVYGRCGG